MPIERFLARQMELLVQKNSEPQRPTDREDIVAKLRAFEPELREAGIAHLFLHGSYVRGTENELSDVDIIAEFDSTRKLSLLGRVHLENRLSDILGVKADLADRKKLLPEVMERAELESVLVF
jgi:predicted nucleotidyltransferase